MTKQQKSQIVLEIKRLALVVDTLRENYSDMVDDPNTILYEVRVNIESTILELDKLQRCSS